MPGGGRAGRPGAGHAGGASQRARPLAAVRPREALARDERPGPSIRPLQVLSLEPARQHPVSDRLETLLPERPDRPGVPPPALPDLPGRPLAEIVEVSPLPGEPTPGAGAEPLDGLTATFPPERDPPAMNSRPGAAGPSLG